MGRCYEFGVEIHPGCEQAMVVTATGGACQCSTCATTCPGRFAGCAAVVAVPGRVPPSAPPWAVPNAQGVQRPSPGDDRRPRRAIPEPFSESAVPAARRAPPPAPSTNSPLAPPPSRIGASAKQNERAVDDAVGRDVTGAIDALRREIRDRDEQLASQIEAWASRQEELSTEIARVGAVVDRLPPELAKPIAGIGESVIRLTIELSNELRQIEATVDRLAGTVSSLEERLAKPASLRDVIGRRL